MAEKLRQIGEVSIGKVRVHLRRGAIDVLREMTFPPKRRDDPAPRVRLPTAGEAIGSRGVGGNTWIALGAPRAVSVALRGIEDPQEASVRHRTIFSTEPVDNIVENEQRASDNSPRL